MTTKEFIIEEINTLVEKFPQLQVRYEVDIFSKSHYIEISPKTFYQNDKAYMTDEQAIIIHFIKKYPLESLTFLTTDDLLTIENPIYVKKGRKFGLAERVFSTNLSNADARVYL
ncbi:MAG: hypothetical protein U5L45_21665 [Saprospiraceae bacterium]|nr:hypothetical protein [Saprospiraceae bacterium]